MLELPILKQEIYGCWRMVGYWEVNFWFARHPATTHEHVYEFDK